MTEGAVPLRSISQEATVMRVLELEDTDGLETAGKYIIVTTSITCTYITSIFISDRLSLISGSI